MGIMGFGKKRPDTIDLTRLDESNLPSNRGTSRIISNTNSSTTPRYADSDVLDLRPSANNANSSSGGFDFLENASAFSTSSSSLGSNPIKEVSELSELKIQMRKITGSIENNSNDVYKLIHRIELLERKIERFENRGS